MRTETTQTTAATTTKPARNARKPALRVEQLAEVAETATTVEPEPAGPAPSHADVAIAIAEERPVPTIDPAIAERLAKEKAKLEREEKAAAARRARIAALEAGKPLPASGKGLPPVVKMNELGALARQLHRATELLSSDEVAALTDAPSCFALDEAARTAADFCNRAATKWLAQFEMRREAGASDNDTLHPLGLERGENGRWYLIEKAPKK